MKNFKKILQQKFMKLTFFRVNKPAYKHEEDHKRILSAFVTEAP